MNARFCVYRHIRLDSNTPFYVGKGTVSHNRATNLKYRNEYHKRITKKHGCKVEIIKYFEDAQEAYSFEKFLIKLYKSLGYCESNLTDGGEGQLNPSQETRYKIGSAMRGKHHTEDSKLKMSINIIPWNKGKKVKYSKEHILAIKKVNCGNTYKRGQTLSDETKLKISKAGKGRIPWNKNVKEFSVYKNNGSIVGFYKSSKECADDLNLMVGSINRCLRGDRYSHQGLIFSYTEGY